MSLPIRFSQLSGEWKGTKRLYLNGETGPVRESVARMTVARAARETFLLLAYSWKFDGEPHEGLLMLGHDEQQNAATAAWGDSWHMSRKIMHCTGTIETGNVFDVRGSYEAPPDPDWGWRIALTIQNTDAISLVMHNISPDGKEELAVKAAFARVG